MPRTMARAVRKGKGGGEPLPAPFPSLTQPQFGVQFRRSELVLIAAEPGDGKSSFALIAALRMGVPTLYISADSSAHEQATRLLAVATGKSRHEIEPWLESHPQWCADQVQQFGHIQWMFDSQPGLSDIEDDVDAFIVQHGEPPALVVVDNVTDVISDGVGGDGEWGQLRATMRELKAWARHYDTCVIALHHTAERTNQRGERIEPNPTPARAAIQGKISAVPALILTLTSNGDGGWMNVCPVKNRSGPSYPDGKTAQQFLFEPSVMALKDLMEGRS